MAELYVGTSGWTYDWNPDGFDWYARSSGLNAVELNASFYRYPFRSQVEGWRRRTPSFMRWSVKVHRLITHVYRLSPKALERWSSFMDLFRPLDPHIDFYLVQLPPSARPTSSFVERLDAFVREVGLGPRLALEWRHHEWFSDEWVEWCVKREVTLVSVDSPDMPLRVFNTTGLVYLRLHGRTAWYTHNYSLDELSEVVKRIVEASPLRAYVFFNNDHDMLHNARELLELARESGLRAPGLF
ncbi:hypothetical protein B6U99_04935 [Candidatus Geothermarchaeota archaeon ex4572_27]|nr:MAG: hypothetical protein B6U99_04935 [Candidatus Geothermarchaeota archaeon ex4572_27]